MLTRQQKRNRRILKKLLIISIIVILISGILLTGAIEGNSYKLAAILAIIYFSNIAIFFAIAKINTDYKLGF